MSKGLAGHPESLCEWRIGAQEHCHRMTWLHEKEKIVRHSKSAAARRHMLEKTLLPHCVQKHPQGPDRAFRPTTSRWQHADKMATDLKNLAPHNPSSQWFCESRMPAFAPSLSALYPKPTCQISNTEWVQVRSPQSSQIVAQSKLPAAVCHSRALASTTSHTGVEDSCKEKKTTCLAMFSHTLPRLISARSSESSQLTHRRSRLSYLKKSQRSNHLLHDIANEAWSWATNNPDHPRPNLSEFYHHEMAKWRAQHQSGVNLNEANVKKVINKLKPIGD